MYNLFTFLLAVHASEADPSADAVVVSKDSGRDDLAEWREHALEVVLGHVRGEIGYIQVSGVLLLLL